MTELFGSFLAGLALFFHGVSGIKEHLQGLTSRRLRQQLSKWSENPILAGMWGFTFGAITQSSTAVAFILSSMVETGLMSVTRALPIVAWANLGTVVLVLFASFNLHLIFLYLLGLAGIAFAFEIGGTRLRPALGALFSIGILFFGLHLMKSSFAPLADLPWFNELVTFIQDSTFAIFISGALLRILIPSSSGIAIIAIALAYGGVISLDQASMMIYGTGLGVALSILLLSSHLQGISRRITLYQALINGSSALLICLQYYIELHSQRLLLPGIIRDLAPSENLQLAFAYLLLQSTSVLLALVFAKPASTWLKKIAPATDEQNLSQPRYLSQLAIEDIESAIELATKEQIRLLKFLPSQLDNIRQDTPANKAIPVDTLQRAGTSVGIEVQAFLSELIEHKSDHTTSLHLVAAERRQNIIMPLNQLCFQFVTTFEKLRPQAGPAGAFLDNLAESLNTMLLTAIDACGGKDPHDADMLHHMTSDRGKLMERIRSTHAEHTQHFDQQQKSQFSYLITLFERAVWLLRQLSQIR
ncbi:MAG: Na/Pi symporter [Verrucomicrobiales bacterium]|nr:Na/Pi symporter [Verrucomicrobiales bacterium]